MVSSGGGGATEKLLTTGWFSLSVIVSLNALADEACNLCNQHNVKQKRCFSSQETSFSEPSFLLLLLFTTYIDAMLTLLPIQSHLLDVVL